MEHTAHTAADYQHPSGVRMEEQREVNQFLDPLHIGHRGG